MMLGISSRNMKDPHDLLINILAQDARVKTELVSVSFCMKKNGMTRGQLGS